MDELDVKAREMISALADGELSGQELEHALALLDTSEQALDYWHCCHIAGDVMRAPELAHEALAGNALVQRLQQQLDAEDPVRSGPESEQLVRLSDAQGKPAANSDFFHWRLVAGITAFAVLASLAWQLMPAVTEPGKAPGLVVQTEPALTEQPTMIRDPRLDHFLAAHQQLAGASALQKPVGFLRNATLERAARE